MRLLHLIIDHQVVERTLNIFERVFPDDNVVLIFGMQDGIPKYKHISKYQGCKNVSNGCGTHEGEKFDFTGITHIIVHYLTIDMISFIKTAPEHIHITWEIYGYDLYDQFLSLYNYQLSYTDPYKYQKYGIIKKYFPTLLTLAYKLKGYDTLFNFQKKKQFQYICKRVNTIQHSCIYDVKYVEKYASRQIQAYEGTCYSLKDVMGDLLDTTFFEGKDIMIGNSASISNNHLYVINHLNNIPEDARIIMPLSYGGNEKYINDVLYQYSRKFKVAYTPVMDYMPLREYNKIFLTLNAIILASWRQESIGNAMMAFYLGIKVFMSKRSPLYRWFIDCGFIVFCIEESDNGSYSTSLSLDEKKHNRLLVEEHCSTVRFENTLKKHFS